MSRGIALSTAGVLVSYEVESVDHIRPTNKYAQIPDIKETPDYNPAPETHEATDLEETEYKFYVQGLKDVGGALEFKANFTQKLQVEWDVLIEKYETALADGRRMWFQISHPKLEKAVFFPGEPAKMGLPAASPNGIFETTLYITPAGAPEWATKVEVVTGNEEI